MLGAQLRGFCVVAVGALARHASVLAHTLVAGLALPVAASAQEIEPREFSNAPVGVNFFLAGYVYASGGFPFDPSIPITNPHLNTSTGILAYARALDVFGMSGKFDVIVPYTRLSGSALYAGAPIDRVVNGLSDPSFRLSVNFYGAPALTFAEFAEWKQDLIVGGSLRVFAPVGQYDDTHILNIGTHRWSFKPEIGLSKAVGPWTFDATVSAQLFTANGDFYGGHRRTEDPVYSVQTHAIRNFESGWWAAFGGTYYWGGQAYVDGDASEVKFGNWRYGATLAIPLDRYNSIKGYASNGISARTEANYKLVGVVWQYRWGGGL